MINESYRYDAILKVKKSKIILLHLPPPLISFANKLGLHVFCQE